MSIIKLLSKKVEKILFTTPSHNQKQVFGKYLESFYNLDYSEIDGFDNLSDPKGPILFAQAKAAEIFGAKHTFFVTQGATSAMHIAMKTLICPGDRILVARNCHKCVFNGAIITAACIDWFMPEINESWGIYTQIDPEKLDVALKNSKYKAFIMTSPTYEGISSNIEQISQICKKNNVYLIVDEAHGTLHNFSDNLPKTAIKQGADISINSLHKTAGALNQCAILNVSENLKNIEIDVFQKALNIFHTSSPSYPLLSNIEACIGYLNSQKGKIDLEVLIEDINKMKPELARFGVEFYESEYHVPTKILIRKNGISGIDLSNAMNVEYNIEDEMCNKVSCLYLTGIGTMKSKLNKLKNALKKIYTNPSYEFEKIDFQPFPITKLQPIQTFNQNYAYIGKSVALNKISNKMIMPYPPGIGILYPGEVIQEWHLDYLEDDIEVMV